MSDQQLPKVTIFSFLGWLGNAFKIFYSKFIPLMLISFTFLVLFVIIFLASAKGPDSFIFSSFISGLLSMVFPLTLSGLTIASNAYLKQQPVSIPDALLTPFRFYNLRLIIVYSLLILVLSFATRYLALTFPLYANEISYAMGAILAFLQLVILVAIPMNVNNQGKFLPFHTLFYAIKNIAKNFIPCLLFILVIFALLLVVILIAQLASKVLGQYALILYVFELWFFATWISLSSVLMTNAINGYK